MVSNLNDKQTNSPLRHALLTFAGFMLIFLLYAIAVQVTDVNLEKLQQPTRQQQLLLVLRQLADPNLTDPDLLDFTLGAESGPLQLSQTTRDTINLILETIFMALIATTIGTVLAVPVSFTAARNLMRDVKAPLAAIMLALTLLPIGGGIGFFLAKWMLSLAETANQQVLVGVVGTVIAGGALWPLLQMNLGLEMDAGFSGQKLAVFLVRGLAALLLSLFLVSSLSHLGARAGIWLLDKGIILGAIGNFIKVIGEFFLLALPSLMGLLGAFVAVALGSTYGQELVLRIAEGRARAITAVLTVTGTAIFVYAIGAGLNWLYQFDNPANWTTIPATVVGIVLGTGSLFVAPKRPFAIGNAIYAISRGILNTLRSIEPLIMAIIFVVWVGLGPFAGVMALTLHTIAALGKLFSEQIEGISEGPIEAITATGANQLQTITYAVIPQIIPPYIAYTLYRWDINVRMSTIIGFVGGGGIGFLLSQSIRLLQYEDASVMMLAIAFVVSALDYISSKARTRII